MDKSVDILYYESMIESVIEDRKIMELVIESKYNSVALKDDSEELAIYEANILETIAESISKLFQRVIDFIKQLIEKISGKLLYKVNKKLVDACNEKIKNISAKERDNIYILNINMNKELSKNIEWSEEVYNRMMVLLGKASAKNDMFLSNRRADSRKDASTNISDDEYNNIVSVVGDVNSDIEERSNMENLKKKAQHVKYDDIRNILDKYIDSENKMKTLNDLYKKVINEMKKHQHSMNVIHRANRTQFVRDYNQSQLSKYRDIIHIMTGSIIKICKFQWNMHVLIFRNNETILRQFLMSNSSKPEDGNYRLLATEQVDYEYLEDSEYMQI